MSNDKSADKIPILSLGKWHEARLARAHGLLAEARDELDVAGEALRMLRAMADARFQSADVWCETIEAYLAEVEWRR